MVKTAIQEARKYSVPLAAARMRDVVGREVDAVLVDGGGVVGDEVDAADLWLD